MKELMVHIEEALRPLYVRNTDVRRRAIYSLVEVISAEFDRA